MCGIAGHLAFPRADALAVRRMAAALVRRGPDGDGFLDDGACSLGHRRLAIIDVAGGAQPIFSEDRRLAVVLNGEIYNYRELREELRPRHSFRTQSDTEVLVHLYEEEGEAMLGRLRGMFALALWDRGRKRLLLARDALGEKPLYYCQSAAGLHFASDLRALKAGGAPLGGIDRDALSDYLELLYIPAPRTIRAGARKLAAGHYLVCDERGTELRRYYAAPRPGSSTAHSPQPTARLLRDALLESVRLRLRSDVPIAALLSGGIDSSAVVALMAQELGPGVRTFAVGFGEADDELPFARLVAERFHTDHHELVLRSDVTEQVTQGLDAYPEPFGDSSAVPAVAVCKAVAAAQNKVVLTGDGGDELFAGYGRYRTVAYLPRLPAADYAAPLFAGLPVPKKAALRRLALASGASGARRYRALIEVFSASERTALLGEPVRTADAPEEPGDVDAALAFDLNVYLPDDLLAKADGASMRWGLEWRSPLVDTKLAALIVPQAAALKHSPREGKLQLKAAMRELLPPEILARRKRGFGSPVAQWLRGPLREQVNDLLLAPTAKLRALFDNRALDRAVKGALGAGGNAHQAWALFALERWLREGTA